MQIDEGIRRCSGEHRDSCCGLRTSALINAFRDLPSIPAEAQKHVAAAKAILDKGPNPEQAQFFPYLRGYVAFYAEDYKAALEELLKANQNDPFIQCLIGQTYEKLGDKDKAVESYRKAAEAISPNPAAAYAVPFAKKKLAELGT